MHSGFAKMRTISRSRRRDRGEALAFGALVAAGVNLAACGGPSELGELTSPPPELDTVFSAECKAYVVSLARATLGAYFTQGRDEALTVSVPERSEGAMMSGARLVVTLRHRGVLRGSSLGEGATLEDVVRMGVVGAIEDGRFGVALGEAEVPTARLEFNALFHTEALGERTAEGLAAAIEPGRHAFEFTRGEQGAYFTETATLTRNYDSQTAFDELCEAAGLETDCYTRVDTSIQRSRAEHWIEAPDEQQGYIELFRGHRVIRPAEIRFESIESAARANADYFIEHQTTLGAFDYQYQPDVDELVEDDNTVRQAGATYAMSKLASYFEDANYVDAARRAVDNLLTHEQELEDGSFIYWGRDDLGVTGLGLLGLVELVHPSVGSDYRDAALRLAHGIASQQTSVGRLRSRFGGSDDADDAQQYYPGEALLALTRTLRRWPEEGWILPVLERAFDYYRGFWSEQGESPFVPWQAAAWANAYLLTEDERYAEFVFELVDFSVAQQDLSTYGSWTKDDYAGAFADPGWGPPNCGTATHSEPIPWAVEVARSVGDEARRVRYLRAERHALRFILQLLITTPETFYMPSPERSLGGVRLSLTDNDVRVDAVQHAATAFLHALEFLDDEPLALGAP